MHFTLGSTIATARRLTGENTAFPLRFFVRLVVCWDEDLFVSILEESLFLLRCENYIKSNNNVVDTIAIVITLKHPVLLFFILVSSGTIPYSFAFSDSEL